MCHPSKCLTIRIYKWYRFMLHAYKFFMLSKCINKLNSIDRWKMYSDNFKATQITHTAYMAIKPHIFFLSLISSFDTSEWAGRSIDRSIGWSVSQLGSSVSMEKCVWSPKCQWIAHFASHNLSLSVTAI